MARRNITARNATIKRTGGSLLSALLPEIFVEIQKHNKCKKETLICSPLVEPAFTPIIGKMKSSKPVCILQRFSVLFKIESRTASEEKGGNPYCN